MLVWCLVFKQFGICGFGDLNVWFIGLAVCGFWGLGVFGSGLEVWGFNLEIWPVGGLGFGAWRNGG